VSQQLLLWGGVDIALIGIGVNGHIGLNEPSDEAVGHFRCRITALAEETRNHSMLKDCGTDCSQGLTLGLADLLDANTIVLMVSGQSKQEALHNAIVRSPSPRYPASILLKQKIGGRVLLVSDVEAASGALF
jgi:galactosamine-6-phosphate isomerase